MSTAYEKNDLVKDSSNNNIYIALTDYTSGVNVAAYVTASNLALVIDASAAATRASVASTAIGASTKA